MSEDSGLRPPIVIAHVVDPCSGPYPSAAIATLAADIALAAPALTVVTGDCTRPYDDQEHAAVHRLPEPRMVLLGLHVAPLLRDRLHPGPTPRDDLRTDLRGIGALGLQSMTGWQCSTGRVNNRQAATVRSALAGTPPSVARIVALHRPPVLSSRDRVRGRCPLIDAMVEARVDVVLAGHARVPSVRQTVLHSGGLSYPVVVVVSAGQTTREAQRSWSLVRIDARTITVAQRHLLDGGWRTGRTVHYARRP